MEPKCKVITLGDTGAGKSSLLLKAADPTYQLTEHRPTIGVDFKVLKISGTGLHVWDTAGQERFNQINRMYYREVGAVLFIFDLSDRRSFEKVDFYWTDFHQFAQSQVKPFCILVGNKEDLQRAVERQEAEAWASAKGIEYIETSAKTGHGIGEVFARVGKATSAQVPKGSSSRSILQKKPRKKRKFC